jgi:hypothetical protein
MLRVLAVDSLPSASAVQHPIGNVVSAAYGRSCPTTGSDEPRAESTRLKRDAETGHGLLDRLAIEVLVSIPGVWAKAEQRKTGKLSDGPGSVASGTVLD